MNGFSLSLDGILGYHIRPQVALRHQPPFVQITFALTIIMGLIGVINGVCSLITFRQKKLREVGCVYYLLASSVVTLLSMMMVGTKLWMVIATQQGSISNRSFLSAQCYGVDFLLRICLSVDQWLSACVAIDRALMTIQGVNFDRKKSKMKAKCTLIVLLVLVVGSLVHDPVHRRLIDDRTNDEDRIWCIVSYSSWMRVYDSTVTMIHFLVPVVINIAFALVIIGQSARQRSSTQSNGVYHEVLREHLGKYKQLLITPLLIVVLSLPRLVISIVSGCMKSSGHSWMYLAGYLLSFFPTMLTFVIFVLPSALYKSHFRQTVGKYVRNVRTWGTMIGSRWYGQDRRT